MDNYEEPPFAGEAPKLALARAAIVQRWMVHEHFRRRIYKLRDRFPGAVHLEWLPDGRLIDGRVSHPVAVQLEDFVRQQAERVGGDWTVEPAQGEINAPWVEKYRASVRWAAGQLRWPSRWGPRAVHYCVKGEDRLRDWEGGGAEGLPPHTYPAEVWTSWRFEPSISVALFPTTSWTQVRDEMIKQVKAYWDENFASLVRDDLRQREELTTHADWVFQHMIEGRGYKTVEAQYSWQGIRSAVSRLMDLLEMKKPRHRSGRPRKRDKNGVQ